MAISRIETIVEPSEKGATTSMANQTIRYPHELISYLMKLNKEILNMNVQDTMSM
jgi:predicted transcriptional regulator